MREKSAPAPHDDQKGVPQEKCEEKGVEFYEMLRKMELLNLLKGVKGDF
ncbi:MAG: hypothetical protein OWQ54_10215 [Sulfolobaceae archaeon]|nr:hypothetical protein [Sulfolobaceae archaeon]